MIKILGFQRVAILAGLLLFNIILGGVSYGYLVPANLEAEKNLKKAKSETSQIMGDIAKIDLEFAQLEEQREKFDYLQNDGFFKDQDRFEAERIFKRTQEESGVVSAVASISKGTIIDDENAMKAEHKILKSDMKINIEAANDLDVFKYIYLLDQYFPGYLSIDNFRLTREGELTGAVLRAIASGEDPVLVKAEINLFWRTMVPAPSTDQVEGVR